MLRIEFGIKGGWQDYYATTFGGFNIIEFNKNEILVNPIHFQDEILLELEYNLMLFRLGKSRNSNKLGWIILLFLYQFVSFNFLFKADKKKKVIEVAHKYSSFELSSILLGFITAKALGKFILAWWWSNIR